MFFKRNEVAAVEAYGKLPIAKDYLRVGCAQDGGAKLRDWLDRAYSGATGGTFPELAWPARFVLGDAWGAPLCGTLWPSSDAGGLRKFPFACFVERQRKKTAADLDAGLGKCAAIWAALDELYGAAPGHGDGQRFLAALRGRELDLEALASQARESVDFASWKNALDAGGDGLARAFRRLAELRRNAPRTLLRLPLASDLDLREQVHAWWRLCAEIGVLAAGELPSLLFPGRAPAAGEPAFALLATRSFAPGDVTWLERPTQSSANGLDDLCDERERRTQHAPPAPESAPPLADSLRGAWTAFLARGA